MDNSMSDDFNKIINTYRKDICDNYNFYRTILPSEIGPFKTGEFIDVIDDFVQNTLCTVDFEKLTEQEELKNIQLLIESRNVDDVSPQLDDENIE
jgi:hypothetical protein